MRAPIARRRVTGARGIPRRRHPRDAKAPLRRPLALLYRQLRQLRTPAAIRAADGRAVPIAPRLQIALDLSLTLNAQHHALPVATVANDAARLMQGAPPPGQRETSIFRRLIYAAPLGPVEASSPAPAEARATPRLSFARATVRGTPDPAGSRGRTSALDTSGSPVADRNFHVAPRQGGGARTGGAEAHVRGGRSGDRFINGGTAVMQRARRGAGSTAAIVRPRQSSRLAWAGRPSGASATALHVTKGSGFAQQLLTLPSAAGVLPKGGSLAARGRAAPLHFAQGAAGRTEAPVAFPSWAPPPLDYRSPEPPSARPPQPEARPAATPAPRDLSVDLEAVSRDVISRIEKRLRIERERRGRS